MKIKNILLIEDTQYEFEKIYNFLAEKHYKVFPKIIDNDNSEFNFLISNCVNYAENRNVNDSKEFLKTFYKKYNPDLIILDVRLKGDSDEYGFSIGKLFKSFNSDLIIFYYTRDRKEAYYSKHNIEYPDRIISKKDDDNNTLSVNALTDILLYQLEKYDNLSKLEQLKSDFIEKIEDSYYENELQNFLNQNPLIFGEYWKEKEHFISQFKIRKEEGAQNHFGTDFLLFKKDITTERCIFVEIERPNLPIFNENGDFNQKFNHACNQINDWKMALANPKLVSLIQNDIQIQSNYQIVLNHNAIKYLLVAGRTKDCNNTEKSRLVSKFPSTSDIEYKSYDDLLEDFINRINALKKR